MRCTCFVLSVAAAGAMPAAAHDGPRVWIDVVGGKIVTLTSDNDLSPSVYTPSRKFNTQLETLGSIQTTDFPGYEVRRAGASVAAGTVFGFRIAGPLLKLDAPANAMTPVNELYPPPGQKPELAVSSGSSFRITNATVQEGFDFLQFEGVGDHAHLSYTMLGGGALPPTPGPAGMYVLPMMLTSAGLTRSDWYFLIVRNSATAAEFDQAQQLVSNMVGALPGDANFDGTVNIGDFSRLAVNFNQGGMWWGKGDFDFDGTVNIADFALLAGNFNLVSFGDVPRAVVPEPVMWVPLLSAWSLKRPRRR